MVRRLTLLFVPAGNEYSGGSHHHHHQAPSASPADVRAAQNFYPTYPVSQTVNSAAGPSVHDGLDHIGSQATSNPTAVTASAKSEEDERDTALFGNLPEAKRRKFILVDDPQRGTRVRVRVMLEQVNMDEMPDSYRKSNSVYPRSYVPMQMQSPPPSSRGGRFPDDYDDSEEGVGSTQTSTLVAVPLMDGLDAKVPMPRMKASKRKREMTLNDLGYRMSWSQSRVFSGRTMFLQRSRMSSIHCMDRSF